MSDGELMEVANKLVEQRVCGLGGGLVKYVRRVWCETQDGHLYAVYEAKLLYSGKELSIWVILRDWTHEGEA